MPARQELRDGGLQHDCAHRCNCLTGTRIIQRQAAQRDISREWRYCSAMPSARPVSTAGLTPTCAAERRKLLELTSFLLVKQLATRSQHNKVYRVVNQIARGARSTCRQVVMFS